MFIAIFPDTEGTRHRVVRLCELDRDGAPSSLADDFSAIEIHEIRLKAEPSPPSSSASSKRGSASSDSSTSSYTATFDDWLKLLSGDLSVDIDDPGVRSFK